MTKIKMTIQELNKLTEYDEIILTLKRLMINHINLAYNIGFQEGMTAATKIQSQVFDRLLNPEGKKE